MNPKTPLLLRALAREHTPRPPVWLMRQAGRYLPEYRQLRAEAGSFMALCQNPELAAEVTLQPITRFGLDAAIIFSDILTVPDAMGLGLHFVENEGPCFERAVQSQSAVESLPIVDANDLSYVMKALQLTKQALPASTALIGFCGSPWTVATYMVEGGKSTHFAVIKKMAYSDPDLLKQLLHKITQSTIAYLSAQIEAGADALMIFDTWGSILTTPAYFEFSLKFMQEIVTAVKARYPQTPITLFTKGGALWLEPMAQTGCDALGLDWTSEISAAHARVGQKVALQGNLDPTILLAGPEATTQETKRILDSMASKPGFIFNLGHGILPQTPIESVAALVETIKAYHD